ncbi:MAG: pyridoxamine 5'-phosphate oxidase family protein [Roseburia porci]|nr:pyridoxamine 5'-phosphate oxidase family protein [Roseburia porci]
MNENVTKLLKEQIWYLGTYSDEPNAVPVAFKDITEDGKLLVGDVFLETTLNNIKANGKIAVSVSDASTLEGYQIKGTAEYITEGPVVDKFKEMVEAMFKGAATAKGALVITPEKIIVTTPGADNKKELLKKTKQTRSLRSVSDSVNRSRCVLFAFI